MIRVLAAVVLYEPNESVAGHVASYIGDVDGLLIIDNTEPASSVGMRLLRLYPGARLITNETNVGIAVALNQAIVHATSHSFNWLLTMDQDSEFAPGAVRLMKEFILARGKAPGLVTPYHHTPGAHLTAKKAETKAVRIAMTSGNMLNLDAVSRCGPFEEKLFIDSVDHEYCLRLRKEGYDVIRLNTAVLYHSLGNISYHKVFGLLLKTTNHSAARRYYITRNRLFVMTRYAGFDFRFFLRELSELIKSFWIILFVENNKSEKINAMFRGTWHFVTGRYGKI